jgi:hypothetical protein
MTLRAIGLVVNLWIDGGVPAIQVTSIQPGTLFESRDYISRYSALYHHQALVTRPPRKIKCRLGKSAKAGASPEETK